jgi:hypothetical protein
VRYAAAVILAGVTLGGAVYLGSLRMDTRTLHSRDCSRLYLPLLATCGPNQRAAWQLPLAVVIAGLGLLAAVGVTRPRALRFAKPS